MNGEHGNLRRTHRRTLERMQAESTPADIRWQEVESLLTALGVMADLAERGESRHDISLFAPSRFA